VLGSNGFKQMISTLHDAFPDLTIHEKAILGRFRQLGVHAKDVRSPGGELSGAHTKTANDR